MEQQKVKVEVRSAQGSRAARRMRREGLLPGVVYGPGTEPVSISVNLRDLRNAMGGRPANAVLLELEGIDALKGKSTILRNIQHDPVSDIPRHADFFALEEGHKITLSVPVHLVGKAAGLKFGGMVDHQIHFFDVEVLPKDIPEAVEVDITELNVGESLRVSELKLPEGVRVLGDQNLPVATIIPPKVKGGAAAAAESEESE